MRDLGIDKGAAMTNDKRDLTRPAIRPYPAKYVFLDHERWHRDQLSADPSGGRAVNGGVHKTLSDQSVYFRYFFPNRLDARVLHERLVRQCFIDYDNEMALVAQCVDPETGHGEILGVGRLIRQPSSADGELAIVRWRSLAGSRDGNGDRASAN